MNRAHHPRAPPAPTASPPEPEVRKRRWLDFAAPVALVIGTAATRLPYLSTPRAFVFDEIYYVPDAASILRNGVEQGGVVHPPGGKWLIAGGIRVFGFTPFGWRFAALVAGCLIVLLTYMTARQLVRGHVIPALAGAAVALDGVSFTTGRVGDARRLPRAVHDARDHVHGRRRCGIPRTNVDVKWCRWGAALSLGLGLTVKWSAAATCSSRCCSRSCGSTLGNPKGTAPGAGRAHDRAVAHGRARRGLRVAYVPWIVNADKTYQHVTDCRHDNDCSLSLSQPHPSARRRSEPRPRVPAFEQAGQQQQRRARLGMDQPAPPHDHVPHDSATRPSTRRRTTWPTTPAVAPATARSWRS